MSFFLPSRLIDFEYFGDDPDPDYEREAKPYQKDIDFAFFAANFGYSKTDYESLTMREKLFIYKAWENRQAAMLADMYNAVFAAVYNVNRGKNRPALKPLKKRAAVKADRQIITKNMNIIKQVETREGHGWIKAIYEANGLTPPERRKDG